MMTTERRRIRRCVAHLLSDLSRRNSELSTASRAHEHPRHFAAAGLARCRALLEGIYQLTSTKGRPDAAGVLLRSLAEAWAVSFFVLLKKQQGIFDLAAGTDEGLRKLIDAFEGGSSGAEKWRSRFHALAQRSSVRYKRGRHAGEPRPLTVSEVLKAVEGLATVSQDEEIARSARHVRRKIWTTESYVSTHANLASIAIPYIRQDAEPWGIVERPEGWMPAEEALVGGGLLTGLLASRVYEAFGYRRGPILELMRGIRLGA